MRQIQIGAPLVAPHILCTSLRKVIREVEAAVETQREATVTRGTSVCVAVVRRGVTIKVLKRLLDFGALKHGDTTLK